LQPDKGLDSLVIDGIKTHPQRINQRIDHKQGIDDDRWGQKDYNVSGERLAVLGGLHRISSEGDIYSEAWR
jgi:hypothetical protein